MMERDITDIRDALHGDGKGRQALIDQVEALVRFLATGASASASRCGSAVDSSPRRPR